MRKRFGDWLDDRLGHRELLRHALDELVPGGARWAYVFGSALVVLLGIQAVTGIALAAYYSPSTTTAWASINYLQSNVTLGWLLRGMHHFGATAMVVVMVAHLLQTVWFAAYRAPRELNWMAGFVLLQLVLAFALTGYLLPWDQKGYWATQVATSIAGTLPLVGDSLQRVLQGGPAYGNLTLTRFYALHVLVLPMLTFGMVGVHLYLFRRHGVTPPPSLPEPERARLSEKFFPGQLFRDVVFALLVVLVVFGLAWRNRGAPLEAPADPASQYLARPEWYFLPLFQLLKYFDGPMEVVGTVVVPGIAMGLLAALPFLHAWLSRRTQRAHTVLAVGLSLGLLLVVGLGVLAVRADSTDPNVAKMEARARKEAEQAKRLAQLGVPVTGPLQLYLNDPLVHGERVFQAQCASCHPPCSTQPYEGDPCLEGYASRTWLAKLLREPRSPHFFGNTKIDEMDPFTGDDATLAALVEYLYGQAGRSDTNAQLAAEGARKFESEGCGSCHTVDGKGGGEAPDLAAYASPAWLSAFIRAPGSPRFYGERNQMKPFGPHELREEELQAVSAYLHAQAGNPVKFP
jgi:ubiquinol-cytochrome c reductase cytochrome b subunit